MNCLPKELADKALSKESMFAVNRSIEDVVGLLTNLLEHVNDKPTLIRAVVAHSCAGIIHDLAHKVMKSPQNNATTAGAMLMLSHTFEHFADFYSEREKPNDCKPN